jgi:Fe-S oxidoreductase
VCCGRPSLSKGLLDRARRSAEALVDRLRPFAERGVQIVGCEPSCVLMVRDEYRRLLPSSPAATLVAAQVRPLSELLGEAVRDGSLPLEPPASLAGREILFHAHCHERAGGLAPATRELLECIPGARVSQLDAGCCGMAGSFGFESEHYELSMRIGELRLFPLLRAAPDALVAATGVSCRQQIRHGTAVAAWHPVELVRSAARVALVPVA